MGDPAIDAREKARRFVEEIAEEHTLGGRIFGTKFEGLVNNCLEILSNQLYEKSTHFLLELIQNADDNVYRCTTPTLKFTYKPGLLRIDCNEVGFDASNVSAICSISESTKSGKTSDGEFIGEKGIGFKSVFKAADVVWIASNEYTFKFDRTRPLGVITPIWEDFPDKTTEGETSICLQLSPTYDEETLVKELVEFDTNLLIFLRRIEEVGIEINRADTQLWKKQIRKTQSEQDSDRIVTLQADSETLKYLIRTHVVDNLPKEPKRPDWTHTKVLLAFPVPESSEQPLLKPQKVYAFLPIRNYGFQFLVQADFLLTASREDIESTLPWNCKIRDALAEAFLQSMFHFNNGVLKYIWPYYLPSSANAVSEFFEPTIASILRQLGDSPVFESWAGDLEKPSTLVHVPADLHADGKPFTLCNATEHRYLSSSYASWVIESMTAVGVSELSSRQFLEDLATLIKTDADVFHNKPADWHAQLATALLKLSTDPKLMPLIQDLAIIPLNDGTWSAPRGKTIFFAKSDASLSIPDGIQVLIVDASVGSDSAQYTLFTRFGVKAWEAPEICRLIVSIHASATFQPSALTITQIVSHAIFLFQASWVPPKDADLWFATAKDERCRGRELYISGSAAPDSASGRIFAQLEKHFSVMHAEYLSVMISEPGWLDWLVQNLGLSRIPRLVVPVVEPRPQPTEAPPVAQEQQESDAAPTEEVKSEDTNIPEENVEKDNADKEETPAKAEVNVDYKSHLRRHPAKLCCNKCNEVFIRTNDLRRHIKVAHGTVDEAEETSKTVPSTGSIDRFRQSISASSPDTQVSAAAIKSLVPPSIIPVDPNSIHSYQPPFDYTSSIPDWSTLTTDSSYNIVHQWHNLTDPSFDLYREASTLPSTDYVPLIEPDFTSFQLPMDDYKPYSYYGAGDPWRSSTGENPPPNKSPEFDYTTPFTHRPYTSALTQSPPTKHIMQGIAYCQSSDQPSVSRHEVKNLPVPSPPPVDSRQPHMERPSQCMRCRRRKIRCVTTIGETRCQSCTRAGVAIVCFEKELKRACVKCCQYKVRCDRDEPECGRCVERGHPCEYELFCNILGCPKAEIGFGTSESDRDQHMREVHGEGNSIGVTRGDYVVRERFPERDANYRDNASGFGEQLGQETGDGGSAAKTRRKMRTGCYECRRRKIRCDGEMPECAGCKRRGRICEGYPGTTKDGQLLDDHWKRHVENLQPTEEQPAPSQLDEIPDVMHESQPMLFSLSKEFEVMLRECDSSDVLQLIRDNWHHYSQWIEGAHMKWQSEEFVTASTALRSKISASNVRTLRGLLPLHDTVLANLDAHLESSKSIPVIELPDPKSPEWNLLSYFDVVMKDDVSYYLRCLIAISNDDMPDADLVTYIYEQLQSKYTGNEELIRAAFYSKDVVLVSREPQPGNKKHHWSRMEACMSKGIDLESKYSSCAYLVRCLMSPSGDPIGGLIHTMTLIDSSSKLDDIARLFREVSKLLKDISTSKAALLLKPLQSKSIFPVITESKPAEFHALMGIQDSEWYIADQANLIESFTGVVPLLAFSIQDLPAVENLFRVLKVEGRRMSKMVSSQTLALGQTKSDFRYSDTFRSKSQFIKALIPRNHPNEATIKHQITELRVRIATAVSQTFKLELSNEEIYGNPIPGHVYISSADNVLTLIMTEETATADCPSHELVTLLAETCGIKDQKHISLLFTALSNLSLKKTNAAFLQQGIKVEGLILEEPKAMDHFLHAVQGINGARMPSPFNEKSVHDLIDSLAQPDGINFGPNGLKKKKPEKNPDRRLPMLERVIGSGNSYSKIPLHELERKKKEFIGWDHMQFLGENMVARLLRVHLGSSFDPERDWTSDLRERAGYTYDQRDCQGSPFELAEPETIRRMTEFVTNYGTSHSTQWKERLRASLPVYHVDVLVSGDKGGTFIMQTLWLERMVAMRMPLDLTESIKKVNVLIWAIKAYSEEDFSIRVIVDPWYIVNDGGLTFSKNWLLQAVVAEDFDKRVDKVSAEDTDLATSEKKDDADDKTGKQLVLYRGTTHEAEVAQMAATDSSTSESLYTIHLPWSERTATAIMQSHESHLHTVGRRETYVYKPLLPGYMRLLYLLPGLNDAPLQALLNHIPCSNAGTYQALSYVWGTDKRDEELLTPDGAIPITSSLYRALQAIRQPDTPIMLWADAVCINQGDNAEKARQIRLMPQIFQACECAYAFLSEGTPFIDQALQMLMQVRAKAVLEETARSKDDDDDSSDNGWPQGLPYIPWSWAGNRIPPLHSSIWKAIKSLFSLPYFRRAWIVQEVVAAPKLKIVCGKWLIDWKDFHAALEIVDREVQIAEHEDQALGLRSTWEPFVKLATQREWESRQYRWSLLMLLEHFRYTEATLARDRLFALVGLASDGNDKDFEPNYNDPLPSIVLTFAKAFIRQGRAIQLLYRAGLPSHTSTFHPKFPSWIPDWTSPRPTGLHDSQDTDLNFSASGPKAPAIKLGPADDEISVEGYEMDVIVSMSSAANHEASWGAYFAEIDELLEKSVLSDTMGAREDLKWKVPIAAAPFARMAGGGTMDMRRSYKAFRTYLLRGSNCKLPYEKNAWKSYMACLRGTLEGWRFVVTKRGFVGVVPGGSQVGDMIVVVKGGCVPFVMRWSEEREGKRRLVGECYIHGVMKGEGIWLPGVGERTFCLH